MDILPPSLTALDTADLTPFSKLSPWVQRHHTSGFFCGLFRPPNVQNFLFWPFLPIYSLKLVFLHLLLSFLLNLYMILGWSLSIPIVFLIICKFMSWSQTSLLNSTPEYSIPSDHTAWLYIDISNLPCLRLNSWYYLPLPKNPLFALFQWIIPSVWTIYVEIGRGLCPLSYTKRNQN